MAGAYIGGPWRPITSQSVSYTGTAGTISNAVGSQTRVVKLVLTTAGFVAIGASPTATTSDMFVPANETLFIAINPGEKVSAIQLSSGGTLYVTEMTR